MRPKDNLFDIPGRIEENYRRSLQEIIDRFYHLLLGFGLTDPNDLVSLLKEFTDTSYFKEATLKAVSDMVTGTVIEGAKDWREAAKLSMQGRRIFEALQNEMNGPVGGTVQTIINSNAKLISTFPIDVSGQVENFIRDGYFKGRRADVISKDLVNQFPGVARARINLISRTESSNASSALTESRSRMMDFNWYIWKSSKDVRVRPSHRFMAKDSGCLISWNDPPSPEDLIGIKSTLGHYHAGNCPNCRCWSWILMNIDNISWPHRVYYGGEVRIINKIDFKRISEYQLKEAA